MLIATDGEALAREDVPRKFATHIRPHAARRTSSDAPRSFEEQNQEAERQIVIQA